MTMQMEQASIPAFSPDTVCRWRVTFSGRVQTVIFRFEAARTAQRLGLIPSFQLLTGSLYSV